MYLKYGHIACYTLTDWKTRLQMNRFYVVWGWTKWGGDDPSIQRSLMGFIVLLCDETMVSVYPDSAMNSQPATHRYPIPVTTINTYYLKTIDAFTSDRGPELQLTLPLCSMFHYWVSTWPGPEQLTLPRGPRFRITTPKTQNCMNEDGTYTCLQPVRVTGSTLDVSQPQFFNRRWKYENNALKLTFEVYK